MAETVFSTSWKILVIFIINNLSLIITILASMIWCLAVVLIFIFSGKKSSFRYTYLLQFLRSACSLLPVSFCSPLGHCPLPPSGCPLIETSASFPLNSLSFFLIFYFPLNYSQSKILAPSLITSGQMCGFGTLFQVTEWLSSTWQEEIWKLMVT